MRYERSLQHIRSKTSEIGNWWQHVLIVCMKGSNLWCADSELWTFCHPRTRGPWLVLSFNWKLCANLKVFFRLSTSFIQPHSNVHITRIHHIYLPIRFRMFFLLIGKAVLIILEVDNDPWRSKIYIMLHVLIDSSPFFPSCPEHSSRNLQWCCWRSPLSSPVHWLQEGSASSPELSNPRLFAHQISLGRTIHRDKRLVMLQRAWMLSVMMGVRTWALWFWSFHWPSFAAWTLPALNSSVVYDAPDGAIATVCTW